MGIMLGIMGAGLVLMAIETLAVIAYMRFTSTTKGSNR